MKIFAPLLTAFVLSACSPEIPPPPSSQPTVVETPDIVRFIELCSGVTINSDQEGIIAVANCLGRVRGYADGAMIMAEVYQAPKPWCVAEQQTDGDILEAVVHWVDQNSERFETLYQSLDPRTAASATIVQALRETFTCRST